MDRRDRRANFREDRDRKDGFRESGHRDSHSHKDRERFSDRDSHSRRDRERSLERHSHNRIHRDRDRERSPEPHSYKDMSSDRHSHRDNHTTRSSDSHRNYRSPDRKPSVKHDYLPTTESLHAKKLAALDHENFLIARQRERDAQPVPGEKLWPKTPPRGQFYFGDFDEEEGEPEVDQQEPESLENNVQQEDQKITETSNPESLADSDQEFQSIRVKAPSASKPSINSFSTSKPAKYGGDLMPGEGTAMAGFIASGQRIPRRGEIGLDSDQISRFETAGYVMSGSRHHLMNAVRMRKENQVISAEEKRMISQMALEERIKREEEIVKTFKSMVEEKTKQKKL